MRKLNTHELGRVSIDKYRQLPKIPVVCMLDNIRSQHNVGSIFRTADAFRVQELLLCGITATPPNREISKAALGATESVAWRYFKQSFDAAFQYKKDGYKLIAIEQAVESINLIDFKFRKEEKILLVFGNEVEGVSPEIMDIVDACIEIPQFGTKHSFNVSVSAGIVLWAHFCG